MLSDRLALAFPVFVVVLLAALTIWLNEMVRSAPVADKVGREDPDFIVENFVATQTGPDGLLRHTLRAKRMTHFPHDDSTRLEAPRLTHFTEKRLEINAAADQALMSSDGEEVALSGNVRLVRAASGDQSELVLLTSALLVLPDEGFARSDQPVSIRNANSRTDAVGLEFDFNARQIRLLRNVNAVWEPAAAGSR